MWVLLFLLLPLELFFFLYRSLSFGFKFYLLLLCIELVKLFALLFSLLCSFFHKYDLFRSIWNKRFASTLLWLWGLSSLLDRWLYYFLWFFFDDLVWWQLAIVWSDDRNLIHARGICIHWRLCRMCLDWEKVSVQCSLGILGQNLLWILIMNFLLGTLRARFDFFHSQVYWHWTVTYHLMVLIESRGDIIWHAD